MKSSQRPTEFEQNNRDVTSIPGRVIKKKRKIREEINQTEERLRQLSGKVDEYNMVDAEMAGELQGLQAGEEKRGSNASQAVGCCMETMVEQFFSVGTDQARSKFHAMCQVLGSRSSYLPLRGSPFGGV